MGRGKVEWNFVKSAEARPEISIQLNRWTHFGSPVRMSVGPCGQNKRAVSLQHRRISPGESRKPFLAFFCKQRGDFLHVEIGSAAETELPRDHIHCRLGLQF